LVAQDHDEEKKGGGIAISLPTLPPVVSF